VDGDEDEAIDPLFHVPSDSYTILNPVEVYAPLEAVLREPTVDGRPLADVAFGEIRQYRGGGEIHMDGLDVTLPASTVTKSERSFTGSRWTRQPLISRLR